MSGTGTWPGVEWESLDIPKGLLPKVVEIETEATRIGSHALFAAVAGRVVLQYGSIDSAVRMQSVRKALMNALIGRAVAEGRLSLSDTMEDLGIDDDPPLTSEEKRATVRDCLMGRSGIYHKAAYEPIGLDARRPSRGSHPPGAYWFYNNWDFNVLSTILHQAVGEDAYSTFENWFARPMQMQEFDPGRCTDFAESGSIHPAYLFTMSARDLARLGLLYLRGGRWTTDQLLPEQWIADSLSPHSKAAHGYEAYATEFGLMWWVVRPELLGGHRCYAGLGGSGHGVFILPDFDTVIVHRNLDEATVPNWPEILPMLARTAMLCRSLAPGAV